MIINIYVYRTIKEDYLRDKEMNLLTQANMIATRTTEAIYESNHQFDQFALKEMMQSFDAQIQGRILIADENRIIVYDSFHEFNNKKLEHPNIIRSIKGETVVREYHSEQYGRTMYTSVPITRQSHVVGVVFLSVSLEHVYDRIANVSNRLIVMSFLGLGMITVISILFANLITKPIKRLTETMQKTAQGKFGGRIPIKGNDEISQLGVAYNLMSTKLSQIDKQRRDFVANVSHELKTPLTSMKLLSESLLMQEGGDIAIYREFLSDIDTEIDRLNKIIESLLMLVDLNEDKLTIEYEITYVNYLVEKVTQSIKPLAEQKKIKIIINQWHKIQIYLDQGKIHQALTNIIYNAVKYTEDGGKVVITLYREGNRAIIKIADNGIGISEEELPYIFERFYRVDSARSRKTGGSGLGLSISEQIIHLHQGTIEVESKEHKGTTVYVKLPIDLKTGL
ncbi:histidine kinase [Alkaliphilus metalliredigens QYMF]|uniref:histidine kinase n=1 Tax=Alkaliphilus metalliredigens (strain QYMF) TaxID=293826 RepID=A6TQL5_ALKMQ|nr:HAMP domain-containing sensor histidine kinase [Alkaliphilus metalliredigens]ABR48483.1 histidine kinase [Alkaliphilus metalliredigens QYMF]